jgi:hypothetical protein
MVTARPTSTKPRSAKASWRKPAAVVMSMFGMSVRKICAISGEVANRSIIDREAAAIATP